jgi:hypothetical protein
MAKSPEGFDLIEKLRQVRDQGMDAWSKAAIGIASSEPYHRLTGLFLQPGLIATAVFRKSTERYMSQALAQLNMPSREDVLALSQRLTRIEVVLDDLSAALDAARATGPRSDPSTAKSSQGNGAHGRAHAPGES